MSSAKCLEILKPSQKRQLVNKCKKTDTKITTSEFYFLAWKSIEFPYIYIYTFKKNKTPVTLGLWIYFHPVMGIDMNQ